MCPYLNPNNSATNLSTLIVVIVSKETENRVLKLTVQIVGMERQGPAGRYSSKDDKNSIAKLFSVWKQRMQIVSDAGSQIKLLYYSWSRFLY